MIFTLIIFYVISVSETARILGVFPTPAVSHQKVFRPVMHALARRGHEVVVITPDPFFPAKEPLKNLREIDVRKVSYKVFERFTHVDRSKKVTQQEHAFVIFDSLTEVFEAQLNTTEVQKLIHDKNEKFDLIFTESIMRAGVGFSYLYNAPIVEFSSMGGYFGTYDRMGAVTNRLVYPLMMLQRIQNMTLWEKLSQLQLQFSIENTFTVLEPWQNEILKKYFGPNTPTVSELEERIEMIFLNVHPIWDFNRPVPPNIVYLGGLTFQDQQPKPLPKDLQSYLDASENGVIYMSLGTNVRPSQSKERFQIFLRVFSKLPYDVLLKYDEEELPGKPPNVKVSTWFPQPDLLKHPKIKLFVTQGGLQSTDESLDAGVPLIAIPMIGDQWFNGEHYVIFGIGLKLDFHTVTDEIFHDAIQTVLGNKSYAENAKRLGNIMRDQIQPPVERAVWWTEHILRHGTQHLRARGTEMSWSEYYMLDIIFPLLIILITIIVIIVIAIHLLLSKYKPSLLKNKKTE